MVGWHLSLLERATPMLRLALLGAAAAMILLGWVVPLMVPVAERSTWEALRGPAVIPGTLWAFLDAWLAWLRYKDIPRQHDIEDGIYEVLREVESLSVVHGKAVRLSECGVKVWAVGARSVRDVVRRERRRPLRRVAASPLYRATSSSGLRWRVGMGVMGMALASNDVLAVDVSATWRPVREDGETAWLKAPETTRLGLTYEEFRMLCPHGSPSAPAGPFVVAVPYYRAARAAGVVVLDIPSSAATDIGLGGHFDDGDDAITGLLYALGQRVFER